MLRGSLHPNVWVPMESPKGLAMEGSSVIYIYIPSVGCCGAVKSAMFGSPWRVLRAWPWRVPRLYIYIFDVKILGK